MGEWGTLYDARRSKSEWRGGAGIHKRMCHACISVHPPVTRRLMFHAFGCRFRIFLPCKSQGEMRGSKCVARVSYSSPHFTRLDSPSFELVARDLIDFIRLSPVSAFHTQPCCFWIDAGIQWRSYIKWFNAFQFLFKASMFSNPCLRAICTAALLLSFQRRLVGFAPTSPLRTVALLEISCSPRHRLFSDLLLFSIFMPAVEQISDIPHSRPFIGGIRVSDFYLTLNTFGFSRLDSICMFRLRK
ncbi:hypothetical protein R3P38DRAFT_1040590 [Favolaschia claudopus]|uniref:Uncharacterized protein n=1 Tax=Favolaschia claudopus TaxID=2862362 RepID=A0AAW0BIT5_9AGAR